MSAITRDSMEVLRELSRLSEGEATWVVQSYCNGKDEHELRLLLEKLDLERFFGAADEPDYGDMAREKLRDGDSLTMADKVALASLVISQIYEIEEFSARQVSEYIKDCGQQVSNITAGFSKLESQGYVSVVTKSSGAPQGQKTYRLEKGGIRYAQSLSSIREFPGGESMESA